MRKLGIIVFFWIVCLDTHAQTNWVYVKTINLKNPDKVSSDRYDNVYVSDEQGIVRKFDKDGNLLVSLSPDKVAAISLLDAWNSIKIFLFYREFQEYNLTDRFLSLNPNYDIDPDVIGYARCMTIAAGQYLWATDDEDFSLKKLDINTGALLIRTPFDLALEKQEFDINFMREYENFLYVNDRLSGILVFDNMGNYKKKLHYKGLTWFGFNDDELYFIQQNKLFFFDLYKLKERTVDLPVRDSVKYLNMVASDEAYFFLQKDGIDIYKLSNQSGDKK